jgi:hypothetical protein
MNLSKIIMGLAFVCPLVSLAQAVDVYDAVDAKPQFRWVRSLPPQNNIRTIQPDVTNTTVIQPNTSTANEMSNQDWTILFSDKTLYRTMRRWAQEAKYQLLWQVERDFPIEAEVTFNASMREAISQVMDSVALTDYPLQAIFNPTTRVVRVVRHMADNSR